MSKIIINTFSIFFIYLFIMSCESKSTFDLNKARLQIDKQNKKYMSSHKQKMTSVLPVHLVLFRVFLRKSE